YAVQVCSADLELTFAEVKALPDDEAEPIVTGQSIDDLELHVASRRQRSGRLDVGDGGRAPAVHASVLRTPGNVGLHIRGKEPEGSLQAPLDAASTYCCMTSAADMTSLPPRAGIGLRRPGPARPWHKLG